MLVTAMNMDTTPIATHFLLILNDFFAGSRVNKSSVSSTGHASTQFMQVVHSSDQTVITLSTFIDEGHAFAQSPQSMQLAALRLILFGLIKFNTSRSAPYGQRKRHQKLLTKIDNT